MKSKKIDIKWEWVLQYMNELGYELLKKENNPYSYTVFDWEYVFTKEGKTKFKLGYYNPNNEKDIYCSIEVKQMLDNGYSTYVGRDVYTMRTFKNEILNTKFFY